MTIFVGGVSELFQGDLDFGRRVVDALLAEPPGEDLASVVTDEVLVEDLHYGAVTIAQRLQEVQPTLLVVVGAEVRGRPPGMLYRRRVRPEGLAPEVVRNIVADAVVGYVGIDLLTQVAEGFDALPPRTVAIELEPVTSEMSEELSPAGEAALPHALAMVRAEVRRGPLLELAAQVAARMVEHPMSDGAAVGAVGDLIDALRVLDQEGRWAGAWGIRDRLRQAIATGSSSPEMEHLDWAQWWGLLEEMDRLAPAEVAEPEG